MEDPLLQVFCGPRAARHVCNRAAGSGQRSLAAQTLVGPNLNFFVDQSSFSAEGSWVPVDPKDHAAYQTETELDCEKRTGECIEASTDFYSGHSHISVAYFQVIKWDSNGIVATNADGICAGRTVSIGFAAKHISDTREAKVLPAEKQRACQTLGIPPNESWTFLLKNSKSWAAERDREHMQ